MVTVHPVRGVRFTKAELLWVRTWLTAGLTADAEHGDKKAVKLAQSCLAKLTQAESDEPKGVDPGPIERVLIEESGGRVVRLTGANGSFWARAAVTAKAVGATEETARVVGRWLARQGWFTEPVTLLMVLNKWPDWYSRAVATAGPRGTQRGLGGKETSAPNLGPSAGPGSKAVTAGRSTPGFR